MSAFKWLEDVCKARTPGKWQEQFLELHFEDGVKDNDTQFIATMGNVADLMLDVVRAADAFTGSAQCPKEWANNAVRLYNALEALKQVGDKK